MKQREVVACYLLPVQLHSVLVPHSLEMPAPGLLGGLRASVFTTRKPLGAQMCFANLCETTSALKITAWVAWFRKRPRNEHSSLIRKREAKKQKNSGLPQSCRCARDGHIFEPALKPQKHSKWLLELAIWMFKMLLK